MSHIYFYINETKYSLCAGVSQGIAWVLFATRGYPHASVSVVLTSFSCLVSFKIDFAMDTVKTSTTPDGEIVDITDNNDSFTKVKSKKCQKRKREQDGADMDTEETVVSKRPQFPPISGDKLTVSIAFLIKGTNNVFHLECFHFKANSSGTYLELGQC